MFTALYNLVESGSLDGLKEDGFKDVFKPIDPDELEKRHRPVMKHAYGTGMKKLKPGEVFTIRPLSGVQSSAYNVIAVSKIFIVFDWVGESMPSVIYKKTKIGTNLLGAVWREERFGGGKPAGSGYWYPAFTNHWVQNNLDKVVKI